VADDDCLKRGQAVRGFPANFPEQSLSQLVVVLQDALQDCGFVAEVPIAARLADAYCFGQVAHREALDALFGDEPQGLPDDLVLPVGKVGHVSYRLLT